MYTVLTQDITLIVHGHTIILKAGQTIFVDETDLTAWYADLVFTINANEYAKIV